MISIVIPMFNEADAVRILYDRLVASAPSWKEACEFILIDDGSHDQTCDLCLVQLVMIKYPNYHAARAGAAAITFATDFVDQLTKKYEAQYVLTKCDERRDIALVFSNRTYCVYKPKVHSEL